MEKQMSYLGYFSISFEKITFYTEHSSLRKGSNQVFHHQVKCDPIKLLAENREFDEMMVEALQEALQRYQRSTGINLT